MVWVRWRREFLWLGGFPSELLHQRVPRRFHLRKGTAFSAKEAPQHSEHSTPPCFTDAWSVWWLRTFLYWLIQDRFSPHFTMVTSWGSYIPASEEVKCVFVLAVAVVTPPTCPFSHVSHSGDNQDVRARALYTLHLIYPSSCTWQLPVFVDCNELLDFPPLTLLQIEGSILPLQLVQSRRMDIQWWYLSEKDITVFYKNSWQTLNFCLLIFDKILFRAWPFLPFYEYPFVFVVCQHWLTNQTGDSLICNL